MSAKDEQLRKECVKLVSDRADYSTSEVEILRRARALANYIKDGTVPLVIDITNGASPHGIVYADATDEVTVKEATDEDEKSDGNTAQSMQNYINESVSKLLAEDERVRLLFDFLEMEVGLEFTRVRREWLEAIVRGQEVRYKYGPRR